MRFATHEGVLARWSMPPLDTDELVRLSTEWLHPRELERWRALPAMRRQLSLLGGRIAAKQALLSLGAAAHPRDIWIDSGIFGQPVIVADALSLELSISHTEGCVLAVATDARLVVGIDAERLDSGRCDSLRAILGEECRRWLPRLPHLCEDDVLLALWSQRESLGKALRIGLTSPSPLYDAASLVSLDVATLRAHHLNFSQFVTDTCLLPQHVVSLSYPRHAPLEPGLGAVVGEAGSCR